MINLIDDDESRIEYRSNYRMSSILELVPELNLLIQKLETGYSIQLSNEINTSSIIGEFYFTFVRFKTTVFRWYTLLAF